MPSRGPPLRKAPRNAPKLPDAGEDDVGIARIDRDVRRAARRPEIERAPPTAAAVGRAIDAARGAVAIWIADRRNPNAPRVGRIDDDLRDRPRVAQPGVAPTRAAVVREPNAVAVGDVVAQVRLARSDPHGVLVARIDGDRADRADGVVRPDAFQVSPPLVGLPNAAAGAAEIIEVRVRVGARDARDAAAGYRRPDVAPVRDSASDGNAKPAASSSPSVALGLPSPRR